MSCNCNSGDTPEYYITLDGVGADGYSPEINIVQEDTASFKLNLINKNNEQLTPAIPKLTYLDTNFVTNSVFSATLANYSTTAQIAATYLSKTDAATTYLKVDGSNANNPITINNLSIQSIGTGTRIGSSGGVLTLQGSGVRPAYLQTGSTSKTLALYTDIPTKTSQLTNDSNFVTSSDIATKMNIDGSNATQDATINQAKFTSLSNNAGVKITNKNGRGTLQLSSNTTYLQNGSYGLIADYTSQLVSVGNVNGTAKVIQATSDKVYYETYTSTPTDDTKEIATLGDISNATITLTQGGVTKGSFTLNQSGSATIALDSGGSTIGNQISLITEDGTKSLTLGVDNTTKKVIANYNTLSEGAISSSIPINLIKSTTAPITISASSVDGLCNIGLDYDTNSLDVDTNNKLAVDSDYIEAHKAYLADGDTLTDPQGLQDVKYYNHSSFDLSKFTIVGSPTITDDGLVLSTSTNNYFYVTNFNSALPNKLTINFKVKTPVTFPTSHTWTALYLRNSEDSNARIFCRIDNNSSNWYFGYKKSDNTYNNKRFTEIQANTVYNITIDIDGSNIKFIVNGVEFTSGNDLKIDTNVRELYVGSGVNNDQYWENFDLRTVSYSIDGQETFSGNKTGVDSYTIGSDTITIPYKLSKTGSKIVDSSCRPEVEAVYEDQGYAPYYTLDETNGNFTLPMGEIYGYITRLEGIVKDLQTRLTALESNIDAGGAGVVQQGLLGMSPLSLSRPQLLGEFNTEDEINTMDIEPIEDDIQEEELEPQETEEETEEGGEDE